MWPILIKVVGSLYRCLWLSTTGEPYTYIMRRNPWMLIVPSVGVIALLGFLRRQLRGEWWDVVAIAMALVIGFIGGHVFWGRSTTHLGGGDA